MMRSALVVFTLFAGSLFTPMSAQVPQAAGTTPVKSDNTGFTSYAAFQGTTDGDGQMYALVPTVGYNFTSRFGMDLSAPFYMVSASSTTGGTSSSGLGDPALDLRYKVPSSTLNFATVLTGTVPVADSRKGLSTGRCTFDWTNHFDHRFDRLKPFGEIGISNTVADTQTFMRPYTSLGFNTHVQAGAGYNVWKFFSLGASGYAILPTGQQTIFSKVVNGSSKSSGHHNVFENNQQTTGSASLASDHGFSAWVHASPTPYLDAELGYTRSMNFDLNAVSFGLGVNLGYLARNRNAY